jgi:hypothetical protein
MLQKQVLKLMKILRLIITFMGPLLAGNSNEACTGFT